MSAPAPIRILSVDDHPLLREGISAMIKSQRGNREIAFPAGRTPGIQRMP